MILLTILAFHGLLASAGCVAQRGATRSGTTCLIKQGCPAPQTLRRCGADVTRQAQPLTSVLATAPKQLGREVIVRSRLRLTGRVCTRKGCAKGTCCNRCDASYVVTTAAKPSHIHPHTVALINRGKGPHPHAKLTCSGDDSKVCCPYPTGQQVVVTAELVRRGTSVHGPTYALRNPRLCLP